MGVAFVVVIVGVTPLLPFEVENSLADDFLRSLENEDPPLLILVDE